MTEKEQAELQKTPADEEERRRESAREEAIEELIHGILDGEEELDELLWKVVLACQRELFYTSSGLPFSYTVKRKKNGEYSGELEVSRKEGSKTLTKSSVLLAFHKVLESIRAGEEKREADAKEADAAETAETFVPPRYKGPKAIGQIFGISYVYSLFWMIGLIQVPPKVEAKLKGNREQEGGDPWGTGKFIIMEDGSLIY